MSETNEKVTLCCWPRTRCPEVEILRNEQKIVIKGEDEAGNPKGEVELSFGEAKLLANIISKL